MIVNDITSILVTLLLTAAYQHFGYSARKRIRANKDKRTAAAYHCGGPEL